MQSFNFYSPSNLKELVEKLAGEENARVIAGGTDILPRLHRGMHVADAFIDISKISELKTVAVDGSEVRVGALATYAEIAKSADLLRTAPLLCMAASQVGSYQTRQRGTIGGSLGNASPAGDIIPTLLVMDAEVTLMGINGTRRLPLGQYFVGPGRTRIEKGEFIHHVSFSTLPDNAGIFYYKHGKRKAMACSLVNIAAAVVSDSNSVIQDVRLALGSVAPTAIRCAKTEELLRGKVLTDLLIERASESAGLESSPIDDVRATADYRRHLVRQLVRRALLTISNP